MRTRSVLGRLATHLFLLVACLLALFPLAWVALTSLKNTRDATASADRALSFIPTLENYLALFSSSTFLNAATISVLVTVTATLIVTVVATMAAYAFARLRVQGRRALASVMVIVQVIPGVVLVIPLYRIVSGLGMYDNWVPIALIMAGFGIPFATWLLLAFFRNSPIEIEECLKDLLRRGVVTLQAP